MCPDIDYALIDFADLHISQCLENFNFWLCAPAYQTRKVIKIMKTGHALGSWPLSHFDVPNIELSRKVKL